MDTRDTELEQNKLTDTVPNSYYFYTYEITNNLVYIRDHEKQESKSRKLPINKNQQNPKRAIAVATRDFPDNGVNKDHEVKA